jgi:hypothetical protein
MIPHNERIIFIYNSFFTLTIKKGQFLYKDKLPKPFSIGAFAEDTLPLNTRTYELPDTTIYTISTLIG